MSSKVWALLLGFVLIFAGGCERGISEGGVGANPASQAVAAPDFTLANLGGGETHLYSVLKAKKAVLLNFWASWCPPCVEEIPDLVKLQARLGDKGFTLLGVDVGETPMRIEGFVKKMGINYPVLMDTDQAVSEKYRIVGIPTTYLVDSQGKVIGRYHAYTPQLVADVERALA